MLLPGEARAGTPSVGDFMYEKLFVRTKEPREAAMFGKGKRTCARMLVDLAARKRCVQILLMGRLARWSPNF